MSRLKRSLLFGIFVSLLAAASWAWAQHHGDHAAAAGQPANAAPAPIRVTMDALHAQGGVPTGWRFLVPPGDVTQGRKVFVALECFACHAVQGEDFPQASKTRPDSGPVLTGMGSHHPPEYFAESIVNPNRVVVLGPGFTGQDGLSKMPDYSDSLTIKQLVDLVAYLKSLTAPAGEHGGHGGMGKMKM
jgi:mono/diheme cytochrome c family protein